MHIHPVAPPPLPDPGSSDDRAGRRELATLLSNLPGMAYRCRADAAGTFEFASEGCRALTGHPPEAFTRGAITFDALVHPVDRARVVGEILGAEQHGLPYQLEYRLIRADGAERWVWEQGRVVRDPDGPGVHYEGLILDVTDRKQLEARLRASETRYRTLVDAAQEGICAVDAAGRLVFANGRFTGMLGYDPAALMGRPVFDFVVAEQNAAARDRFGQRQRGIAEVTEYALRRADGSTMWARVSASPLTTAEGAFDGAIYMVSDVTEARASAERLQQSERQFRALIENASDTVVVLDAEGIVWYVSPSGERQTGYPAHEVIGTRSVDRVHPEDLPAVEAALREVMATPSHQVHVQYRYRHRGGGWRTLRSVATNLLADPAVAGVVVNSHDITEQERLGAQLRQAQKLEAVGRLAGGVAHDFNNLLTVISSSTRFAREELPADSAAQADLAEVDAAAARAAALTRQLLAFGRQQVLRPQVVDLNRVAGDVAGMLRRVIGADVQLMLELSPEPTPVYADAGQLEQVLMNLAVNARDAMPDGGTLEIRTRRVGSRGQEADGASSATAWVALSVRDTGIGMSEATQARVFEPFFTTKAPGQGTGLGLATAYGIVSQSGGQVRVESTLGLGSTFTVLIPEHHDVEAPTVPAAPAERREAPGRETILLVEDEPQVRSLTRRMLERGGYTVLEAPHGLAALRIADEHGDRVSLVLTDVVMPEMGARDLLERLRIRRPTLPALLMSGYSAEAVTGQGVLVPGTALVSKPFTQAALLRAVRETLDAAAGRSARTD
jgi:PAS domain S-box-containing protein